MFKDLVMKNRTYRGYDESCKIDRATLLELIDLTRYTAASDAASGSRKRNTHRINELINTK